MSVLAQNQNQNQDEEQNSGQTGPGTALSNAAPITAGSTSGGSGPTTVAATPQNKPTSSGSFTNIKSFLDANKNFNNGQGLSGKINQNISNQGQQLQGNVASAVNNFNQQAQGVINPLQNTANTTLQSAVANPLDLNGQQQKDVQNLTNATYTGPKTLNDVTNSSGLNNQVSNFVTNAKQTSNESGRMNVLKNMFNNPTYNQGQQSLDNLFLQGSNLQQSRNAANAVNNNYNKAVNVAQQQGQNYQNQVSGLANNAVGQLNSSVMSQGQNIQNEYNTAVNAQNDLYNKGLTNLASGKITQDQADRFGLKNGMNLYTEDLSKYLNKADLNPNTTATQNDYQRLSALNNLIGNHANTDASKLIAQYAAQPDKLLTDKDYVGYDKDSLQTQLDSLAKAYNDKASYGVNAVNSQMPFADLMNPFSQGGIGGQKIIQDPLTLKGATYGQMDPQQIAQLQDMAKQQVMSQYAIPTAQQLSGGTTGTLTPQGQAQVDAAKAAQAAALANISNMTLGEIKDNPYAKLGGPDAYGGFSGWLQGQKLSNLGNLSPLDFFKNYNFNNTGTDFASTPNIENALGGLKTLIDANKKYNPGRTLQVLPEDQGNQ